MLKKKFLLWIIFGVIITAFCGLVYVAVQQDLRLGANNPQIQMAEDAAATLSSGQKITPLGSVNVGRSLAPFLIVYNSQGQVTSSSGELNGKTPELPAGVLDKVKSDGEQRFTWQPQAGVRIAAVVTSISEGYILAGRSLREIEKRENQLGQEVLAVWLGSVALITLLSFLL